MYPGQTPYPLQPWPGPVHPDQFIEDVWAYTLKKTSLFIMKNITWLCNSSISCILIKHHISVHSCLVRLELLLTSMHICALSTLCVLQGVISIHFLIFAQSRCTHIRAPITQRLCVVHAHYWASVYIEPCISVLTLVLTLLCYFDSASHFISNILFVPRMTHACLTTLWLPCAFV